VRPCLVAAGKHNLRGILEELWQEFRGIARVSGRWAVSTNSRGVSTPQPNANIASTQRRSALSYSYLFLQSLAQPVRCPRRQSRILGYTTKGLYTAARCSGVALQ